ncbi:MAG: delta-60 repeat domain-containing protein, partial [Bacteroidales bacterium]
MTIFALAFNKTNLEQRIPLKVFLSSFSLQSEGFSKAISFSHSKEQIKPQRKFAAIAFMMLMLALVLVKPATAQTFNSGKWVPNAQVQAVANDATYTYIGGDFTSVCPPNARYGAKLTTTTVVPDLNFPAVNGTVNVCVPDGSGGWFIGGTFTQVGTDTRNNLARINSSGSVTSWDPNANNTINAITIDGSSIYVGGSFTSINGATTRNRLAKLNNTDGTADATWNPNANNTVYAIAVSGSTIYVGGIFTTINGATTRNLLARLNNTNGTADALWNPNVNTVNTVVTTISISGTDIYIGGSFDQIHGYPRKGLAKMLTTETSGTVDLTWAPALQSLDTAFAIAISGSDIYVGGHFSLIYPSVRNRLAKLNNTTGAVNATWDP